MRVAVTGSTGFIGLHLVRALVERRDDVVAIARATSDTARLLELGIAPACAELDDVDALAEAILSCSAVVHLAGGGVADQRETWRLNAEGTDHVIAACRAADVRRLVLASTVSVTRRRVASYGASKREAEHKALTSGLDVSVLRFAFVYGPGRTGVFARLVNLARRLPVVLVVGTGKLDIGPVYVDDVARAIVASLERPDLAIGKVYTLAGPPATFDDVVAGVLERVGPGKGTLHLPGRLALALARALELLPRAPITRDNVLGMIQEAELDSSLAREELGFSPRALREGLDATFARTPRQS
jgi:NADH dehydrogenase